MKISSWILAAVALGCTLVLDGKARADIAWTNNLNWARSQALASGKPMMIDFYTDWCGWCEKLDKDSYPDPRVQNAAVNFIMVRLDAEKGGDAAARHFQVQGFPTLLFLTPDFQNIGRIAGYLPPADLAQVMNQVLAARPNNGQTVPAPALDVANSRAARTYSAPKLARTPDGARSPAGYPPVAVTRHEPEPDRGVLLLDESGTTQLNPPASKPATKASVKSVQVKQRNRNHGARAKTAAPKHVVPVAPVKAGILAGGVVMSDQ